MESQEARPGMVVMVEHDNRRPEFVGMVEVIKQGFGGPNHAALDVQLEDGRFELFWYHQLEKVKDTLTA